MGEWKYKAVVEAEREDIEELKTAMKSGEIKGRAKAEVRERRGKLRVEVKAKDASALRAALNSYLRILQATERIGGIE